MTQGGATWLEPPGGGAAAPCFELEALDAGSPKLWEADLPLAPGGVTYDMTGRAVALHIAPRRWLVSGPDAALYAHLIQLVAEQRATLTDISGKWRVLSLASASAGRILDSAVNRETLLNERQCALTRLFDCPAIVLRSEQQFELWIGSSYLESFMAAVAALRC